MTLEEHAAAISAVIEAAAEEGFYVDDTNGSTPVLDLNDVRKPYEWDCVRLVVAPIS